MEKQLLLEEKEGKLGWCSVWKYQQYECKIFQITYQQIQ